MKRKYLLIIFAVFVIMMFCVIEAAGEQYSYDDMGRVTKVTYENGDMVEYEYDSNGNIKSIKNKKSSESQGGNIEEKPGDTDKDKGGTTENPGGQEGEAGNTGQNPGGEGSTGENPGGTGQVQGNSTEAEQTPGGTAGQNNTVKQSEEEQKSILEKAAEWVDSKINDTSKLKKGEVYEKGKFKYKVTSVKKRTVKVVGVTKKKKRTYTIPKKVRIEGCTLKVTAVGANVFKGCKKCKTIKIKSKTIKSISKKAFSGLKKANKKMIKKKGITVKKLLF